MCFNLKVLPISILLIVSTFQKEKNKCLIILENDNKQQFNIGKTANSDQFYIYLKYNYKKKVVREPVNPLTSTGVDKYPEGVTYNLFNRSEINELPTYLNKCKCSRVDSISLGMKFKLYVEKDDVWQVYDAQKFLVEE